MAKNLSYVDREIIRQLSKPSNLWGAWLTFHVWAVMIGVVALFMVLPNPITFIFAFLVIGSRQHGLAILVHEAAHGILFKSKTINDWVGKYLLAAPYGGDLLGYRRYHLQHHKFTQSVNDPDLVLSEKFPVSRASLKRKFIRDMTGQTFLRIRLAQWKAKASDADSKADGQAAFKSGSFVPTLLANLIILVAFMSVGLGWAYFALWLLPQMTWFYAVIRLRNIAEHAMTTFDDNPLTHARTVKANFIERLFIAPYWVNYHVEHHAFMFVPCHKFPKLHAEMIRAGWADRMEIQPSYKRVLQLATHPTPQTSG